MKNAALCISGLYRRYSPIKAEFVRFLTARDPRKFVRSRPLKAVVAMLLLGWGFYLWGFSSLLLITALLLALFMGVHSYTILSLTLIELILCAVCILIGRENIAQSMALCLHVTVFFGVLSRLIESYKKNDG